jgi:hypothetical protein
MTDWHDPAVLEAWREEWCFSTTLERLRDLDSGNVPDYVLLFVQLAGQPKDLIDLAEPTLESRLHYACTIGQKLAILRMLTLALEDQSRAEKYALAAADALKLKRSISNRLADYLSGR